MLKANNQFDEAGLQYDLVLEEFIQYITQLANQTKLTNSKTKEAVSNKN